MRQPHHQVLFLSLPFFPSSISVSTPTTLKLSSISTLVVFLSPSIVKPTFSPLFLSIPLVLSSTVAPFLLICDSSIFFCNPILLPTNTPRCSSRWAIRSEIGASRTLRICFKEGGRLAFVFENAVGGVKIVILVGRKYLFLFSLRFQPGTIYCAHDCN